MSCVITPGNRYTEVPEVILSSLPLALPFVAVQKSLPSPAAPGRDATCARGALAPAAPQHGDPPSSSAHHAASSALQPTTSLLRLLRVCSLCFASHARSRLASAWILRSLAGVRVRRLIRPHSPISSPTPRAASSPNDSPTEGSNGVRCRARFLSSPRLLSGC